MKILNSIKTKFIEILKDESGQGTTEYILILVAIVGIAALFRKEITLQVDKIIQKLGSNITDAIG